MYTIDTSVFITATESHEAEHVVCRQLLGLIRQRRIRIIVPTLVTVEVAGAVSRLREPARGQRLAELLLRLRMVQFIALDSALARVAAQIAADHRLRGADAVYAAVTQQYGTTLVSRDGEHQTRLVGIVPVQNPQTALTALLSRSST